MTYLKTIFMTLALLVLPSAAFAQVSTDSIADELKEKAVQETLEGEHIEDVDSILENKDEDKTDELTREGFSINIPTEEFVTDTPLEEGAIESDGDLILDKDEISEKESDKTYTPPLECPSGTELTEDGSCMVLK